eukprot:scaffold11673_cov73-Cyclotella_meneghiniana.AAC.1
MRRINPNIHQLGVKRRGRPFSTEELVRSCHQPLEPPWRPPWPPPSFIILSEYHVSPVPPIHPIAATMSSRPSKAYVMPGRVLGVTPETICSSPQRKSRSSKGKRSAGVEVQRSILRPSAPSFQPASSIPTAPAPPLAPGAIEAAKKAASNQRFRSTSKASETANRTYSSAAAASKAADPPADAAASSSRSRGVRVDESKNEWKRFEESDVDDDDEWEDVSLFDDRKPPAREEPDAATDSTDAGMDIDDHIGDVSVDAATETAGNDDGRDDYGSDNDGGKSVKSTSSDDSDEPQEMYADLAGFKRGKIKFILDKKKNFYWADYSRLNVKEMKALLHQRDQG